MPQIVKDYWLLLAVGAIIFFGNLGAAPLWDRDEPRNAGCTAEMLRAGEFVVPIFNNELRTHKPIMLYWLMMLSYGVFGINEFGARAVSAFAGMGTLLLTYAIGRNLFGRGAAFWAGLVLASTIMFSVAARAATPDALLILCGTLAIYFFVRGSFGVRAGDALPRMPSGRYVFGMYAAMGLGVLVKGPVGVVLPAAVIGMYLLIVRLPARPPITKGISQALHSLRPFSPPHFLHTCWHMRPLTALLIVGMVAVPWYASVHLRTQGVWTTEFFWIHNVSRASATMEGHSGPPILFYIGAILVGFFPWSVLTVPVALQIRRSLIRQQQVQSDPQVDSSEQQRPAIILLLCWVGVYIGLFSLAKTKLPSYVTPCYPALALLFGHFLNSWQREAKLSVGWIKVGLAHWIILGAAMVIGLPVAAHTWLPGSQWLGIIGTIPLVGGIACWYLLGRQRLALDVGCYSSEFCSVKPARFATPEASAFGSPSEPYAPASGVFREDVDPQDPTGTQHPDTYDRHARPDTYDRHARPEASAFGSRAKRSGACVRAQHLRRDGRGVPCVFHGAGACRDRPTSPGCGAIYKNPTALRSGRSVRAS